MEQPCVSNLARDESRNVTFDVLAYRKLSRAELLQAVRFFESSQKKKLKKDSHYTITTLIGLNE
ncbi:MAG: hypothetical protein Aurels2KO_25730 [Aureliella sp.]